MRVNERSLWSVGVTTIVLGLAGCGSSLTSPGGIAGRSAGTGGAIGSGGSVGTSGVGGLGGASGLGGAGDLGGLGAGAAGGLGGGFATGGTPGNGGGLGEGGTGLDGCTRPTPGEVPPEHRPTPPSCAPNTTRPLPDGGVPSCTTSADCVAQGYGSCTAGQCVSDACLADGDCQKGYVCACAGGVEYRRALNGAADGGACQPYPVNICVPATCRMDSDCGAEGYCSPSYNGCGGLEGYYCHGPADTCVDATRDCQSCGSNYCIWSSAAGAFTCAFQTCISVC
jgi:hypothetical protein